MTHFPHIRPLNEKVVVITFGQIIDPEIHAHILAVADWLQAQSMPGLRVVVPAYASITLHIDPLFIRAMQPSILSPVRALGAWLEKNLTNVPDRLGAIRQPVEIPVQYGGEQGPDLSQVAAETGLSETALIRLHTETLYTVYMIGFLPGFPYLGTLPSALELPRRTTPRLRVPAGSVAIAGRQTGIYPQSSPGGWHLIGRTSVPLFDPHRHPPTLLAPGDRVRFVSVQP